jgi:hypothetical protein
MVTDQLEDQVLMNSQYISWHESRTAQESAEGKRGQAQTEQSTLPSSSVLG